MSVLEEFRSNFYKSGKRVIDPIKIVYALIIIIILGALAIYGSSKEKQLVNDRKQNTRYVVGIIGDRHKNFRSSQGTIDFSYQFMSIKYARLHSIGAHNENMMLSSGDRFYVEISSKDPGNSKLLLDFPVPDGMHRVPSNGWDHMPGFVK